MISITRSTLNTPINGHSMNYRFLLLVFMFLWSQLVVAQSSPGDWAWIGTAGSTVNGEEAGNGVARDKDGNLYITGGFLGTATFGGVSLISTGQRDGFIAKYSPQGTLLWAHRFGGNNATHSLGIAVDSSGNSYVTGYFNGKLEAGSVSLNSQLNHFFIVKFDAQGNAVWGRQANGGDESRGLSIAVNAAGRIWVSGEYLFPTSVNGFVIGNTNTSRSGGFLLSMDTAGTVLWARAIGNSDSISRPIRGSAVAIDASDNAYLAGSLTGTINFAGTNVSRSTNAYTGFIAKFDTTGTIQWVNATSGNSYAEVRSIAVDTLGQAYVTGEFYETLTVGSTNLTRAGNQQGQRDVWVAKLDTSGQFLWAVRGGGNSWDEGLGIAVDGTGNAFVTGFVSGSGTFGDVSYTTAATSNTEAFVAKINSVGQVQWMTNTGSMSRKFSRGIVVDDVGNSYVTGMLGGPTANANFGSLAATVRGAYDIFLAKLSSSGSVQSPYVPSINWPTPFSGVTPSSNLAINVNTIGLLVLQDMTISSCVNIQSNGQQSSLDGVERFDIGFKILDMDQGIIQIAKTRPFNQSNALTASGEKPDCSGVFEATTNRYKDFIRVEAQTFTVEFELVDDVQMRLVLRSAVATPLR